MPDVRIGIKRERGGGGGAALGIGPRRISLRKCGEQNTHTNGSTCRLVNSIQFSLVQFSDRSAHNENEPSKKRRATN